MNTTGRRVLITGAASGLGAALVCRTAAAGDRVLATDLQPIAPPRRSGSSSPGGRSTIRLDVTSDDDWAAARDWVTREWGGLDVLVNNAGIAGGGRLEVAGMDEWQRLTEVNLLGVARGMRTFVPLFKQQRSGHIVNVASLAGLVPPAGMAGYNAVKAAVVALSETASHELAAYGVRCSVVCPSYFRSPIADHMDGSDPVVTSVVRRLVEASPASADDIAAAILGGIEHGDELILPDEAARAAYALKHSDRAAYDEMMRAQAAKLEAARG
jgi:NAD(P)-dependent dehydrogenase (short-subunit alcohol dehydrogenase family)